MSNINRKRNRLRKGGGHHTWEGTTFPVYFDTDLYTCKLISKYECITIYMNAEAPVISHQKRTKEYVIEYRMLLNDAFTNKISEATFQCRYQTTLNLCRIVAGIPDNPCSIDLTRGRAVISEIASINLTDIERIDRYVFDNVLTTVNIFDDSMEYEFNDVRAVLTLNRFGEIRFGKLELPYPQLFSFTTHEVTKLAIEGFLHLEESPEKINQLSVGEHVTFITTASATQLRVFDVSNVEGGGDFEDDFNNDFNI